MGTEGLDPSVVVEDVGTKVLVAAGSSPPERRCIAGELVWVPPACNRPSCSCTVDFTGATTHGLTDMAEVGLLDETDRRAVRRTLAEAMCRGCSPSEKSRLRAADALLDAAARLPLGTTVRRVGGVAVPVPRPARRTVDGPVGGGAE